LGEQLKGSKVTHINLWDNNLGLVGVEHLLGALRGSQVTAIKLWKNGLSPDDARKIAPYLKGTFLTTLQGIESKYLDKVIRDNFTHYWGRCFAEINYWQNRARPSVILPTEIITYIFDYVVLAQRAHQDDFLRGYQMYRQKILERSENQVVRKDPIIVEGLNKLSL